MSIIQNDPVGASKNAFHFVFDRSTRAMGHPFAASLPLPEGCLELPAQQGSNARKDLIISILFSILHNSDLVFKLGLVVSGCSMSAGEMNGLMEGSWWFKDAARSGGRFGAAPSCCQTPCRRKMPFLPHLLSRCEGSLVGALVVLLGWS